MKATRLTLISMFAAAGIAGCGGGGGEPAPPGPPAPPLPPPPPPPAPSLVEYAATFPRMPTNASEVAQLTGQEPIFASGTPYNDVEYTMFDTAYIEGETSGYDTFMPVDPSLEFPGADRVHVIVAVNNLDLDQAYDSQPGDRIILGDQRGGRPYFLRGENGLDDDYLVLANFDYSEGRIDLAGSPEDYELVECTAVLGCTSTGNFLFHTAGEEPDLVAFIFPCDDTIPPISGAQPRDPRALCNTDGELSLDDEDQFNFDAPPQTAIAYSAPAFQFGGAGLEIVSGAALDHEGDAYILGQSDLVGDTGPGGNAVFVTKVSQAGEEVWTWSLNLVDGSLLFDAVADEHHLYVAGRTQGALPGETNQGRWDAILLKLRLSDGELVAQSQHGGSGLDGYGNIILDGAGSIYVSGQGSETGSPGTDPAYLIARYRSADLSNVWRHYPTPVAPGPVLVSEAWGGISLRRSATGDPEALTVAGWFMTQGGADAFIETFEDLDAPEPRLAASTVISSPGSQADWILDTDTAPDGSVYAAGFTTGDLDGLQSGQGDIFVARLNPDLTLERIVQRGTGWSEALRKGALLPDGSFVVAGYSHGDLSGSNADRSRRTADVIVNRYGPDLALLSETQIGTAAEERAFLAVSQNRVAVAGMTEGAIARANNGSFDAFLLRLDPDSLQQE